jgi:tetratricopeptide (TPR) repeat protein
MTEPTIATTVHGGSLGIGAANIVHIEHQYVGCGPPGQGSPELFKNDAAEPVTASNIPIRIPEHFLGRDDALASIDAALKRYEGRVAITALHGLRGVGKTTLAAAYAELHRADYRATWWIRAQTESTTRADLAALGVRLGWVAADEKEKPALATVRERLRHEGEGLLLIYDNAIDAASLKRHLPPGGAARVLVTSNAHAWRGVAAPVEIRLWPNEIGADYLIVRTGREKERADAEALSDALGGLPLAHEQAAAYCERLEVSLAEYRKRFDAAPAKLLDAAKDAPGEYHDGLTVSKTFALAIDEAAKLHPAAEPLIVHAALLAPEPIPLFLFAEGREQLGEPLTALLADDGLEEALAALRAFALVDRETIPDERDPTITTETIRLHRLVREVAAGRCGGDAREQARGRWTEVVANLCPGSVYNDSRTWPRMRRLDSHALDLVGGSRAPPSGAEMAASVLLDRLGQYRQRALAAYSLALPLLERALAIREKALGPEHSETATSLNNLALLLLELGDLAGARPLFERALTIDERALGPEHPETATNLNNLAGVLHRGGDLTGARPLFERALAIREKALGPEHIQTAKSLNNLANLLRDLGDFAGARPLTERALGICENALGPDHPETAPSLNNLARLLQAQGDIAGARPLFERALAVRENALGPEHPDTATSLNNLARLLQDQGDLEGARPLNERALAIREKSLGPEHADTATSLNNLARLLQEQRDLAGARPLFERALAIREKALGPEHPETATSLNNLARLLQDQGDLEGARPLLERALLVLVKSLGAAHPNTNRSRHSLARLRLAEDRPSAALALAEAALAAHETAFGGAHSWTQDSARTTADALDALDRADEAAAVRARYGIAGEA